MPPPYQGFETDDMAVGSGDDWLVLGMELPPSNRSIQVMLQPGLAVGEVLGAEVKNLLATPSPPFCLVHGHAGVVEQTLRRLIGPTGDVVTPVGEGDAD